MKGTNLISICLNGALEALVFVVVCFFFDHISLFNYSLVYCFVTQWDYWNCFCSIFFLLSTIDRNFSISFCGFAAKTTTNLYSHCICAIHMKVCIIRPPNYDTNQAHICLKPILMKLDKFSEKTAPINTKMLTLQKNYKQFKTLLYCFISVVSKLSFEFHYLTSFMCISGPVYKIHMSGYVTFLYII